MENESKIEIKESSHTFKYTIKNIRERENDFSSVKFEMEFNTKRYLKITFWNEIGLHLYLDE